MTLPRGVIWKYDDLLINDGSDASLSFEQMIYDPTGDHSAIRRNLLDYCKLDTQAIVRVFGKVGKGCRMKL